MSESIKKYIEIIAELRDANILTNKGNFTGQIGEWLVAQIFGGKRATSSIQKGWDVEIEGKFIQVKTHSKAEGNSTRWSSVTKNRDERVDELIIIVFTHHYKLLEFYRVPWEIAQAQVKTREKNQRDKIHWSAIQKYRVEIDELPR